jgi:alpha-1,2-mannosyltransferase
MYYYAISLRTPSFLMVNSSWTKAHVDSILQHSDLLLDGLHLLPPLVFIKLFTSQNAPSSARIVYPPCDTRELATFPLTPRQRIILSVAQFRFRISFFGFLYAQTIFISPEKDHQAQLKSFHRLLELYPEYACQGERQVKLVLMGGSRNEGDARRVEELRGLAKQLGIEVCLSSTSISRP